MKVNKHPRWFKSQPASPQFEVGNVDVENGTITDVVMCQVGEAKGHGVHLEQSFIDDLVAYAQEHFSEAGLKARFSHPAMCSSPMGTQLGMFKNFRVRENQAIADLHLLESADKSPTNPGMREWMLSMAQEQPDFVMSSIVFAQKGLYQYDDEGKRVDLETNRWGEPMDYDRDKEVFVVMGSLYYCDLVEAGAATDNLFSARFNQDKFAVQVVDFLQEKPELLNFLKRKPEVIAGFAAKLGIELPKPTYTFGDKFDALKGIFGTPEKPDTTMLDAANARIKELEDEVAQLKTAEPDTTELDAANARITELEAEVVKLKERVPEPTPLEPGGKGKKDEIEMHPFTRKAIEKYNRRKNK